MKRFDKGYIYSAMLSDLFVLLVAFFGFSIEFIIEEEPRPEDATIGIPFLVIGFVVIYLCLIAYRILYYKTSGYEITETEIRCNRGVIFKKRSILEYKKIHAINKKQSIFNRIVGIAVLTVDSGSTNTSHQAEITIVEKASTVDLLLNKLNALKDGVAPSNEAVSLDEEVLISDSDSLFRFTSKGKMLYTLINIASTAFFTLLYGVLAIIVIGGGQLILQQNLLGTIGEFFLAAIVITAGAMILFSAFSFIACMLYSFIVYHNFAVTKHGDNIQISFGLLEKHTNTFSYDRIKAVKIYQGLVQRLLGFASIKLEVIGYTNVTGNDTVDIGVLVPFCKYNEVDVILNRVLPSYIPDEKQTKSVALFPFMSWFLLFSGIITGVSLSLTLAIMGLLNAPGIAFSAVTLSILTAAVIALAVKTVSAVLSYKNNGIAINNGKITVHSGGFTKTVTVFKAENLIAVENVTTPLRQKNGIASLIMHLKTNSHSNEVKVHIQKEALTEELKELLVL